MKCAVKLNKDNRLKQETARQSVKFMLIAIGMYLGDKRGWKTESIVQAIKGIVKISESINENYTTYKEMEQALCEDYGIVIDKNGNIYNMKSNNNESEVK